MAFQNLLILGISQRKQKSLTGFLKATHDLQSPVQGFGLSCERKFDLHKIPA